MCGFAIRAKSKMDVSEEHQGRGIWHEASNRRQFSNNTTQHSVKKK
jgi:hypothetical protein